MTVSGRMSDVPVSIAGHTISPISLHARDTVLRRDSVVLVNM
jgi:hypothetical protein